MGIPAISSGLLGRLMVEVNSYRLPITGESFQFRHGQTLVTFDKDDRHRNSADKIKKASAKPAYQPHFIALLDRLQPTISISATTHSTACIETTTIGLQFFFSSF
eukprot:scaffold7674_cov150-Skeletonema_marinoi.AAC.1